MTKKEIKEFISLFKKIDKLRLEHYNNICHKECEKYLGKDYKDLIIPRCTEEEFILWWNKNKNIPYNNYFYELVCYVWDVKQSQHD